MEADEMRVVSEFAALAPSVHNTQPWRFVSHPHSLEVHVDPTRGLSYLDPRRRQMYLSCGVVVEFARLAIRSLGLACIVRLLPDPDDETLVAKLVVGLTEPATPVEERLISAISRRYTDRGPYTDTPVSVQVLEQVRAAAAERRCWLRVIDRPEDRVTAIRLLSTAEAAEANDPAYQAELASWRRVGPSEDGVPVAASAGWESSLRVSDVPLRDFTGHGEHPHPGDGVPPVVERDTVIVLGSDQDDLVSWLHAGRALAGVLLTITDADLVSQPLGPVLDLTATRAALRRELGLVGYPQMILRVGHGLRGPAAGRRRSEDMFAVGSAP